ncbi:glutamic acid-rich protein-like [Helianthus annuus]|uniref:glutamic acid-rich protein-like n=1 Tax=Helianthus annuus TaxID=4232 RepID=UPI000B908BEC|nr:glutamic acid-rich protein-like [Helianthus annuus]
MIYLAIQKKDENDKDIDIEVKFNVANVRRVLDLRDSDDDPIIVPERLCKGLCFRMGFTGHVNDKYLKSKFCRLYKFIVHCVIQALSHRKGAYDETSDYIMNIITWLVLNRPYNISQVLFDHMIGNIKGEKYIMYQRFIQMLLNDQVPDLPKDPADELNLHHMTSETLSRLNLYKGLKEDREPRVKGMICKIKDPNYVAPENDAWRHENSDSEDETERLSEMHEKKQRSIDSRFLRRLAGVFKDIAHSFCHALGNDSSETPVPLLLAEPAKKKSPPILVDEPVIDPTELIKQGADLLNMTFDQYIKHTAEEAAKVVAKVQSVEKVAETSAKNVEAENVKEKEAEGVAHTDSSTTESDTEPEIDTSKIGVGKIRLKVKPQKKKKDSDEEDSTYIPTPQEKKKKVIKKRKAHPSGVIPRNARARKGAATMPKIQSHKAPEVESIQTPEVQQAQGKAPEVESIQIPEVQQAQSFPEVEVESVKAPEVQTIEGPEAEKKKPESPDYSSHSQRKILFSGLFEDFPEFQGDFPFDLPEGDHDMFHNGKIKILTKKVSILEKAKAKAETEHDEVKKKLAKTIEVNEELKLVVNNHAERINELTDDLGEQAKLIDQLNTEFAEVNAKHEKLNKVNKTLHQMIAVYNDLEIQRVEERRAQREKELAQEATQKRKGLAVDTQEVVGSSSHPEGADVEMTEAEVNVEEENMDVDPDQGFVLIGESFSLPYSLKEIIRLVRADQRKRKARRSQGEIDPDTKLLCYKEEKEDHEEEEEEEDPELKDILDAVDNYNPSWNDFKDDDDD